MPLVRKDQDPFGRQPLPVTVTLTGDDVDVQVWISRLHRYADMSGPDVSGVTSVEGAASFTIYPRAVND
jgi:hypothetical protein